MPDTRTQRTIDQMEQHIETLEAKLSAMTKWLEVNQPDVFKRGLWEAIG